MSIRHEFPPILWASTSYTFEHLTPLSISLDGAGRDGASIRLRVSFQTHVYSKRDTGAAGVHRLSDEAGLWREFCPVRYQQSLTLPDVCQSMIVDNFYTWEEMDRNRVSNLAVTERNLVSGITYLIVYYLFPSRSEDFDTELVIKSAYSKYMDFGRIKRRFNVKTLIKKSYYEGVKVPK